MKLDLRQAGEVLFSRGIGGLPGNLGFLGVLGILGVLGNLGNLGCLGVLGILGRVLLPFIETSRRLAASRALLSSGCFRLLGVDSHLSAAA